MDFVVLALPRSRTAWLANRNEMKVDNNLMLAQNEVKLLND